MDTPLNEPAGKTQRYESVRKNVVRNFSSFSATNTEVSPQRLVVLIKGYNNVSQPLRQRARAKVRLDESQTSGQGDTYRDSRHHGEH